ncbi:MAG: 3-hydroxyacyl-ACP dehydratase FabZ family protein [Planctomycetia bacterium]|nr:3-hydroxyacyl-ACP dehydratase FabZ family protein [Planctomycetia bacterium]
MDRQEIKTILPHREPMLLLDRLDLKDGVACGAYLFRGDEWFFQGHFPDNPIAPGVILCEILAQSASVLIRQFATCTTVPYLVGVDRSRFHRSVRPGDLFETECRLYKEKPPFFFFKGLGTVRNKVCVKTSFSVILADQ